MIKTLIFDFDGLILDTETPEFHVWQAIYHQHDQELPAGIWGQIVGGYGASNFDAAQDLQLLVGVPLDLEALRARHRRESNVLINQQPLLPGVMEYLNDARRLGLRLTVASSSGHSWVDTHLTRLGLFDYFDAILCAEDVGGNVHTKPHPDIFLKALAAAKTQAGEAVAFEDSPNGVKAAKAAGIFTVAVPNFLTGQLKIEGADLTLKSLADLSLPDLLKRVGDRLEIRPERPEDIPGIRCVEKAAFDRPAEADLVDLIRMRDRSSLSLVAVEGKRVLGHVLFSPVTFVPPKPVLSGLGVGPLAVLPEFQGTGIGSRLMQAGLNICLEQGYGFIVLVGHPTYYSRFGFTLGREFGLTSAYGNGDGFMVLELKPGVLQGARALVRYLPEFKGTGC